ncbi:MAG: type III secretion system outer membrane ring subunit SctC [Pseudomonadota bacterium]|nr:type III secretion system outer membrane ring subunit SctC [Pseudomonadota bacterium]
MRKLAIVAAFLLMGSGAIAQESWEYRRASHIAMGETMTSFFSDLGSSADVLMQISDAVKARRDVVTATYTDKKIIDIMNDITGAYGLLWYWDGQTIYVYDASELQERKVELYDNGADKLMANLKQYGFYDGRYNIRSNINGDVVFFAAPPRYAQLITQVSEEVNRGLAQSDVTDKKFRFKSFPLKYATAYDREVVYNGRTQVIEGVATLLNRVVYGQNQQETIAQMRRNTDATPGAMSYGRSETEQQNLVGQVVRLDDRNAYANDLKKIPSITADKHTNSIVVYDTLENINLYEEFIRDFDKPTEQIEISVSIIDVQSDDMNEIGVSWAGNGTDFDVGFGSATALEQTNSSLGYVGFGNYQNTTTLMASQVKTMMGNIKLINQNNGTKVLSKPAVVTQDNVEAIIDHISTFYVRLEGQEEVELVPIRSGSVLRVIPRLLGEEATPEIKLEVSIEDGTTNENTVDDIPVVSSSTIKTQAVVNNGESLLVGGFYYDSELDDVTKVPVLGDVPVVGSLFRHTKTRKVQLSRLFLITPKIIGKKLDSMQKLSIADNIEDVTRGNKRDYLFNGMIMD